MSSVISRAEFTASLLCWSLMDGVWDLPKNTPFLQSYTSLSYLSLSSFAIYSNGCFYSL